MLRYSLACSLLLLGSSTAWSIDPPDARERGRLAIHARAILKQYCFKCHGGANHRGSLHILEHRELTATTNPVPFVSAKKPDASQIIHFIEDGSMPPSGNPRPTSDDVKTLKRWIAAGAPRFPVLFDDAGTLAAIHDDLRSNPEASANLRYISLAHLITEQNPRPDLLKAENDLRAALKHVGVTELEPVNDTATLFRFDVTKAPGWSNRELFVVDRTQGITPLSIHDVLLLEYPHGFAVGKEFTDYFSSAKLTRPILFLRGDWVSRVLLDDEGKPRPLAADMKSLIALSAGKEERDSPSLGFGGLTAVLAAPKAEPRSPLLPLNSWYSGDVLPDPSPFPLTVEVIDAKEKQPLKSVPVNEGFLLRVTTKRNVRFVLLQVLEDGSVRPQPTKPAGVFAGESVELSTTSGAPFRITGLVTGEKTATIYFVLFAAEADGDLPSPTIVRSKHAQFPIYRFLFDPGNASGKNLDPAKVVRKVIPVPVKTEKPK